MQIHEITFKKRVNEGFMDAVKGIGSIAAGGVNQALGTNIGGTMAGAQMGAGSIAAQKASTQLAATLAPKIAQEQSKLWSQNIRGMMQNQQVMSPSDLDKNELVKAVNDQVNRLLQTYNVANWKDLPNKVNPAAYGGSGTQAAKKVVQDMGMAINNLVKNVYAPGAKTTNIQQANDAAWKQIADMVIQIQNLSQFASGTGAAKAGQPAQAQQASAARAVSTGGVASPSTQAAMAALGTNPQGLAQLNALVKRSGGQKMNPTGNQYVDALLKTAKLL